MNIINKALHASLPIVDGVKYVCNKWIHVNKYK